MTLVQMQGINYEIIPTLCGKRYCVAMIAGDIKRIVTADDGVPMTFATAESAHRWVCL